MADMGDEAQEVQPAAQGNPGAHARLNWTSAISSFVLRPFTELVGEGVKTDKGFKDVHLNRVAKDLSEWGNLEVSGSQVYNHLRKWRARWVKICKLKELSGALWDEDLFMITLAPEHYSGHVKVT
jgi:methionine salvage enolase-phosphatase E1